MYLDKSDQLALISDDWNLPHHGDNRDTDNMSQMDRLINTASIVHNSDMEKDDMGYCLRAILYAMLFQEQKDILDEWRGEPGVLIAELFGVMAYIIVVAHSHISVPLAVYLTFCVAFMTHMFQCGEFA